MIQQSHYWNIYPEKTIIQNGPKTLTGTSPREIYRWQISIRKDVPHPMSSGKCKIKLQRDITTHPIAKIQNTNTTYWREWGATKTHSLLVGMKNVQKTA